MKTRVVARPPFSYKTRVNRLTYLLVAGGGALGTVARFWLSGVIGRRFGETFPWGTLLVNVSGCLAIGFFAAFTGTEGRVLVRPEWRLAFMSGVLRRIHHVLVFQFANDGPGLGGRLASRRT
ncbi:MAG TPA: CrcB family protein [Chthoniobacterales bacterium]|nr:CrcB family protein [Chthoniobacterales bacterium]